MSEKKKTTENKILLGAYYKAAKPALKYKWCYVVLINKNKTTGG